MQKLWKLEKYKEVSSTNDIAKDKSVCADNLVIIADVQYMGRGRRGNKWLSQKGNLFFSQMFTAKTKVSDLAFVSSLSLVEAIKNICNIDNVSIKWPNDILIDEKKVAGILIEQSDNEKVIVGIGVNICKHPKEQDSSYPTTDIMSYSNKINKKDLLKKYLSYFDENYALCLNNFGLIRDKWLQYAVKLNEKIKVKRKEQTDEGIFKGIDEHGLLLLEQKGKIIKISSAEVFF